MEKSEILFRYPCGCVGLGLPHAPTVTDKGATWHNVQVVSSCDSDEGWHLPMSRVMEGADGNVPTPLPYSKEEEWDEYCHCVSAQVREYRNLKNSVRALLK